MKIFETVAQMKLARLKTGQLVETKGYYAPSDGGQARYMIEAAQAVDGYGDHTLANSNTAILQSNIIFAPQFGVAADWNDGTQTGTDDTAAIRAMLDYATDSRDALIFDDGTWVRFTDTLELNGHRIMGNNCQLVKDFAGVGININGSSVYTYLFDFLIAPSTANRHTDYEAAATAHGIVVNGTRVKAYNVSSNRHRGWGWKLDNTGGNMNKSVYEAIAGGGNTTGGCLLTGDYPTSDDMSVWNFSGEFQANYGFGLRADSGCPLRQSSLDVYAEDNFTGASAPSSGYGALQFDLIRSCTIIAYAEQIATSNNEIRAEVDTSDNIIVSRRRNDDLDSGSSNSWRSGNIAYKPTTGSARSADVMRLQATLARVSNSSEYVGLELIGSGGGFGYIRGYGEAGGNPIIKLLSSDESSELRFSNSNLDYRPAGYPTLRAEPAAALSAGETSLSLYDLDNATLEQVTVGAADSGGSGYKVLRIPN